MSLRSLLVLVVLLTMASGLGCAAQSVPDEAPESALAAELPKAPPSAYFVGRQDTRRCRFPLCGGYFIQRVERTSMRCDDGTVARECYVALLDTEALGGVTLAGFGSGKVIVRGALGRGDAGEFGPYPLLRVGAAWEAASDRTPSGTLYLVSPRGTCAEGSCPLAARRLATGLTRPLASLVLEPLMLTPAQTAAARRALSAGGVLASGTLASSRALPGFTLTPSQLYLPVEGPAELSCTRSEDCVRSFYRGPVRSSADCYCRTCPTPMLASEAERNEADWQALCAATHDETVCPLPPCAPPPPVACREGTCGYGDFEL